MLLAIRSRQLPSPIRAEVGGKGYRLGQIIAREEVVKTQTLCICLVS